MQIEWASQTLTWCWWQLTGDQSELWDPIGATHTLRNAIVDFVNSVIVQVNYKHKYVYTFNPTMALEKATQPQNVET